MSVAANPKLVRNLFRSFYRIARKFDLHPASKSLLYRNNIKKIPKEPTEFYYRELTNSILFSESNKLFNPMNCFQPFADVVCNEFKKRHDVITPLRIDAGFTMLRALSSVWFKYIECLHDTEQIEEYKPLAYDDIEALSVSDTNDDSIYDFPVRLTNEIKAGTLLIAHPLMEGHVHRAVILLLDVNKNGAYGLIINIPSNKTLEAATRNVPKQILDVFGDSLVQYGGGTRRLQFLHPYDFLGGSVVESGLFAGGDVMKALELVKEHGKEAQDKFSFYAGCCFWTSTSLHSEIDRGFWIPVIASSKSVFNVVEKSREHQKLIWDLQPETNRTNFLDDDDFEYENEEDMDDEDEVNNMDLDFDENEEDSNSNSIELKNLEKLTPPNIWNTMMKSLGSDYAAISVLPEWLDADDVESLDWK